MGYLILALVERVGLGSLYEFRQQAGLEPGGIRSALAQLEQLELVERSGPGKRRRRELILTDAGRATLTDTWGECLRDHLDAESVLRSAFVAWLMGGSAAAADYLDRIADIRRERRQQLMNDLEHLHFSQTGALFRYAWMRTSLEAHRRSAESEAFSSMSGFILER